MIEKVTLQLSGDADFTSEGGPRCEEMNPKTLLLYAAAKCVGKTALMIMDKERFRPKRFEIGISGELSDETPQSESTFKSFHVVYNIECDTEDDQAKVSRAVTLAHEKYCGMMQMLRKVAPVSHEIAVSAPSLRKPETTGKGYEKRGFLGKIPVFCAPPAGNRRRRPEEAVSAMRFPQPEQASPPRRPAGQGLPAAAHCAVMRR